ncbi:MAG TPA: hypothetical protein PK400_11390 [Phycisphaerales bacterium]|nr:hypothetical protein [Phycisphaerales bacterium]
MRRFSVLGTTKVCAGATALLWLSGCVAPESRAWSENGPIFKPEARTASSESAPARTLVHVDADAGGAERN